VRLIAGSGGAPTVNFVDGAAVAFGGESFRGALNWRGGGGDGMACGVEWRARARTALKAEHREGEAGRGCRAACVAGAWRPRGERALTRSGAAHGNDAAQR